MGGVVAIPLTQGKFTLVDADDAPELLKYSWYAKKSRSTFVAARKPTTGVVYMHRAILGVSKQLFTDHRDGNGLDNRRSNLRACTVVENNRNRRRMQSTNTSGYRGVFWERSCGRWRAQISVNDKNVHLGVFMSKENAARAYEEASRRFYGEFSPLGGTLP